MSASKKGLYVATVNNRVVIYSRHYIDFYRQLKELEPECKGRDYYKNKFGKCKYFNQWIEGTQYHFEKLL